MFSNLKKKIQEGFTLVEILIVVVIVGILAAIAIPTYFNYVEKAYASDAQTQLKTILEEQKIWMTTHAEAASDLDEMREEGSGNISKSTEEKWEFEWDLQRATDGTSDLVGTMKATSKEDMPGGPDKEVCFNAETGKFSGYGTKDECEG